MEEKFCINEKNKVKPPCKYFGKCGNCNFQNVDYPCQLLLKKEMVERELKPFLKEAKVEDCKGLFYPYKYRNKLILAFGNVNNELKVGFFKENTKEIVDIEECLMHESWATKLIYILRNYVKKFKIETYDIDEKWGNIRYAVARFFDGFLMLTIVSAQEKIFGLKWLFSELKREFKQVSLYQNINDSDYSNVFGQRFIFIDGQRKLLTSLSGIKLEIEPKVFIQTNTKIASQIYCDIVTYVKNLKTNYIIDAYSGIGITSLLFAKNGLKVTSVEIEKQSVYEARRLAKLNNLEIDCQCGDAKNLLPELTKKLPDATIFVDPPRNGLESAIEPIIVAKPKNLIYLSCSLDSLKQDLSKLIPLGYAINLVKPYDMFPHTNHVETLVCLSLNPKK
ncbi:MAG: 23S rRNA (uracil(1939)-C(5))-methyltransferase RlmD [Clostridia bacterium]